MKKITDEKLAERIALLEHAEADTGQLSLHGEAELACLRELRGYRERQDVLQQKLDSMAAESTALKAACTTIANSEEFNGDGFVCDFDSLVSVASGVLLTPATDAYLNSVRAEAVSYVADHIDSLQRNMLVSSNSLRDYAVMFRSGTHDTADEAG